jgi:hypothetical protein
MYIEYRMNDKPKQTYSVRDPLINGRVDLMTTTGRDILPQLNTRDHSHVITSYTDALTGEWESSVLSRAFFSSQNIQILHNAMRAGVYARSNGKFTIPEQSTDTLKVIMRSVYIQTAKHQPMNITGQIEEMNAIVTSHCVNQLYGELVGYMNYKRDVSMLRTPMDLPIHFSSKKTLESVPWK